MLPMQTLLTRCELEESERGFWVGSRGWRGEKGASYKLPRRKTPARRILRSLETCNFQIKGMGRARVRKSVMTFKAASVTAGGVN